MIAVVSPPATTACRDRYGNEKRAYFRRSDARRKRMHGQHVYRCPQCGWFHLTFRSH